MEAATTPSAVTREPALAALLPSLMRSSSSALSMSPLASVRAFLHSIMGASVFARSSPTMLAVIAAILSSTRFCSVESGCAKGAQEPPSSRRGAGLGGGAFLHFHELLLVATFGDRALDVAGRVVLAFEDGFGHFTHVQRHSLGGVVVARDHVVDAFGRVF